MLWAIFNLSRNPGAQRKLLEEIREVVSPDQDPCGEHIKSMPYLKACLKESMRYSRRREPLTKWHIACRFLTAIAWRRLQYNIRRRKNGKGD